MMLLFIAAKQRHVRKPTVNFVGPAEQKRCLMQYIFTDKVKTTKPFKCLDNLSSNKVLKTPLLVTATELCDCSNARKNDEH